MNKSISIKYPESLADILKLNRQEFETEIKTSALAKLFELGKISSGTAAKVLGVSRIDFLDLLARYNVSVLNFESTQELENDATNA